MKSKIALVTGASSDIGLMTSEKLLDLGYQLILTSKNIQKIENNHIFAGNNQKVDFIACDLTSLDSINELITHVKSKYNSLDLIINLAAIWHDENEAFYGKNITNYSQKTIIDTYFVGIIAPTILINGLANLLKPKSFVINISGTFENGASGWIPYFVSKRAIEDLTVAISGELSKKNIYSLCISPSDTATSPYRKFFPNDIESAQDPSTIANLIYELLTDFDLNKDGQTYVVKKDKIPFIGFHH